MRESGANGWRATALGAHALGLAAMAALYAHQPLLAPIAREFGRSALEANLIVSMTTLGIAVGVFPSAWLAERVGRGAVVTGSLALGTLFTGLSALMTDWPVLVALRLATGLALSGVLAAALVWSTQVVGAPHRGRVAAMYVAGTTAGGMTGRIASGLAAEAWGWRIGVLAADAIVLGAAVAGVLAVALTARRNAGRMRQETLGGRGDRAAHVRLLAIAFAGMAVFMGVFNATAFRVHAAPFSLGVGVTSLLFLTYAAGTVSSMRTGALLDRFGPRATILAGAGTMLAGVGIGAIPHLAAIVAGLLVLAGGFFMLHAGASATVPSVSRRPTVGQAWYTLFFYAGSAAGALLLGWAWDAARWPAVTAAAVALIALAAVAAAGLPRR